LNKTGKRLYYNNSYLLEFESVVEAVSKRDYYEIILRESAFYPESGGQLFDTGSLNGFQVGHVYANENDEVVHCCEMWSGEVGQKVLGRVDGERRFDNMKKHTGQHILSQAFLRIASAETVGAHLGEVESTIELDSAEIRENDLRAVESLANDIIMQNLPVNISYHDLTELAGLGVRRIPKRQGEYRLIGIGDFELTACGGTHCAFTGEIGLLKVVAQEKIRGHSRITFLCGHHSVIDYYLKNEVVNKLTNRLTCHFSGLDDSVQKIILQNENLRKQIGILNKELLPSRLKNLENEADDIAGLKIIKKTFENYDIKGLRDFAMKVTAAFNSIVIFNTDDTLIISVSGGQVIDAAYIARLFVDNFGGRGGGNQVIAQVGGIPKDTISPSLSKLVDLIAKELGGN